MRNVATTTWRSDSLEYWCQAKEQKGLLPRSKERL